MKRLAVIALTLVALPSAAWADPFSASFSGTGFGTGVTGYNGSTYFNVFAGQLKWDAEEDFLSFCLQLDSPLRATQQFGEEVPGHIGTEAAAKIAVLVAQNFSSISTDIAAAGLQLAIWNLIYDGDSSATEGAFRSASAAGEKANEFLKGISAFSGSTAGVVFLNSNPTEINRALMGQDQVTKRTVPEPTTLLLFGVGAATLAARRRSSRRVN